ncbi:MAG: carbohydrate-binding domain-containing protein, partial [Bacteroidales bacterium]|nr:carbohydrate-binding domain-containing protein [Bacteroidales bacterium]
IMKKLPVLFFAALSVCACNTNGMDPFGPFGPGGDQPMPPGTEGSTYEFSTIEYDGLLSTDSDADVTDKSDSDIYWEAEAESDGTFKNTIIVTYARDDATVEMSKNAGKVYTFAKEGAHVVLYPSGDDVKKCEIILKGSSENGSLKIYNTTNPDDKEAGKKTKLTLNGVSLKSGRGPAINYQAGKRLFLHLTDGTENYLEDCVEYKEDAYYFTGKTVADEDRKGCFFSEKAVVVSGIGRLTVKGNYKHSISVDNDFYMRPGPTVVVTGAAKNCLHCNDEIHFTGGYFYANNSTAGGKGVKTDSTLVVDGGRLVINTSGTYGKDDKGEQESPKGIKIDGDITVNAGDITVRCIGKCDGSEGIESKKSLTVNGGKIDVMAYDDAMNAATLVKFTGGETFCLSTHNDGIDSNGDIKIVGGKVTSIAANMEAAMDNDNPGVNSTFTIDGGEIIGIGGTVYSPSSASTQYTIVYNGCPLSTTQELAVKDESGTKILAVTSPQGSQSAGVLLSSSKFVKGGKYTISIGDTVYQTVTLSNKITTIGSQTGPGGGGGFGPGRF